MIVKLVTERVGHACGVAYRLDCSHGIGAAILAGSAAMAYQALSATASGLVMILSDAHLFGSFQDPAQNGIILFLYGLAVAIPATLAVLIWRTRAPAYAWAGLACSALALGACAVPTDGWTFLAILAAAASLQGLRGTFAKHRAASPTQPNETSAGEAEPIPLPLAA